MSRSAVPKPPARSGGAYVKLKRKVGDFAAAAAAVQITLDAKGAVERAAIALTNAGPTPVEAADAARSLLGKVPDEKAIAEAARLAAAGAAVVVNYSSSKEGADRVVADIKARQSQHDGDTFANSIKRASCSSLVIGSTFQKLDSVPTKISNRIRRCNSGRNVI